MGWLARRIERISEFTRQRLGGGPAAWARLSLAAALALGLAAAQPALAQQAQPGQQGQTPTTKNPPAAKSTPTTPAKPPQTAAVPGQIDLNSATPSQLRSLPGIGKSRANAIVKNRPYKSPDELVSKKVIPGKVYEGIKDKVEAR